MRNERRRVRRPIGSARISIEYMGADLADSHKARCPVRRNKICMVARRPEDPHRIASVERSFRHGPRGLHGGKRHAVSKRTVAGKAELAPSAPGRPSIHDAAYRFGKSRIPHAVEDDFGDRLPPLDRFARGFIGDRRGHALNGAAAVIAEIVSPPRRHGRSGFDIPRFRPRRGGQQYEDNECTPTPCHKNEIIPPNSDRSIAGHGKF